MDSRPLYFARSTEITLLTEYSEEQLLETAIHYDEAALGELYDRYEAKIYSYIFRRTGEQTLAEDLTAQVFLKMLEAIRNRKAWHSSFSGWLYRIAHNLVIDHYRQRGHHTQVPLEDAPTLLAVEQNPVESAEMKLDAERLRAAISRLTDEQAEVISLRFLEGYSITEVAEMMNKTEGSIKALQYRAVATLRQFLQYEPLG
jgi:RNA polymerase sigma-70 factor (ECF subfamily)